MDCFGKLGYVFLQLIKKGNGGLGRAPSYLQAYPVLTASDLLRHVRGDWAECSWDTSEGDILGHARVRWLQENLIKVDFCTRATGHLAEQAGEVLLSIEWTRVGPNHRPLIKCLNCSRGCAKLILSNKGWGCRVCLKLRSSSASKSKRDQLNIRTSRLQETDVKERLHFHHQACQASVRQESGRSLVIFPTLGRDDQEPFFVCTPRWGREPDGRWASSTELRFWGAAEAPERPPLRRDEFRYWEAYPAISAVDARKAHGQGRNLCLWQERGRIIGGAEAKWGPERVSFRYAIQRSAHLEGGRGEGEFEVCYVGSQDDNKRPLFKCQSCGQARSALGFRKGRWACRDCHGLHHRSALVGTKVRWAEKYTRVRAEVEQLWDEPKAKRRLEKKFLELEEAYVKAGPPPHAVANESFNHVVTSRWDKGRFAPDGFYD